MFTNLDLPFVIVYMGVTQLWIEASKRLENKEPILFFSWVPTPIVTQYDLTRVMLPEATAACFFNRTSDVNGPIDCDYGVSISCYDNVLSHDLNNPSSLTCFVLSLGVNLVSF